jgi:hypothetical protein
MVVALFALLLRVNCCGPFFARLWIDQRSIFKKLGTGPRKFRSILVRNIALGRLINMSEKKTIRIVKKGETPRPAAKPQGNSAREAARDMVDTVTNWVTEFQQKRRTETAHALRILSKTPRGSEA